MVLVVVVTAVEVGMVVVAVVVCGFCSVRGDGSSGDGSYDGSVVVVA